MIKDIYKKHSEAFLLKKKEEEKDEEEKNTSFL